MRGPLTDLLLAIYRRCCFHSNGLQVIGGTRLLDFWLYGVGFG